MAVDAETVALVTEILREVARAGECISYSELEKRTKKAFRARGGSKILKEVSKQSEERGEGMLTALVVKRAPPVGDGYYTLAGNLGRGGSAWASWIAEVRRVHAVAQKGALVWEEVAQQSPPVTGARTLRARVPGGWLVTIWVDTTKAAPPGGGLAFVPDPTHSW